ncbi:HesB/YadR/YfhF family protein [Paenibacillus sp. DMB20]|uniref:HesB/YadR/YfhF family protein n=1 Tax=Paenibacillus sp. DMB20 TaxID=1642570 RepID=UPI0006277B53|nr:Fe-S cluster assembly protein HesB [Paenibacillus sp. DMB20]KKO55432.1 Fe-S cluster assembly protein HesB [Paenibacillus sp. DMB20]
MKIVVTDAAVDCFQKDWDYHEGDYIRIYVRYSGGGEDAFAFGITRDDPRYPAISNVHGGIAFFIEENDLWYLNGRDLIIDCFHEDIVFARG